MLAPDFETLDHNDTPFHLAAMRGTKVVLYFYPADDTPTCTTQACNLRDNHAQLTAEGYTVFGISPDSTAKHRKFIAKYGLPFALLTDPDHRIASLYGVWGEKKFMGRIYDGIRRTTFVIDATGCVKRTISQVNSKAHAAQII